MRMLPIAAVLTLLGACASPDKLDPTQENLHTTLQRLATRHHVCGVTIAVIKDRKLDAIESATGCLPALALNQDSIFQAASLGKPVFTYAVLKLAEQGKLEIDAPVMQYLPQGYSHQSNPFDTTPPIKTDQVTDPRINAVTVRMILNHTSGLPNWSGGPLDFKSDPGTKWQYSGEGFVLLQRAVEAVTGEHLDKFMVTQVFRPQAMEHSDYVLNPRFGQSLLPGTTTNGTRVKPWNFTAPIASATLYTSAADYGKFLVTVLNDKHMIGQITEAPVMVDPGLNLSWGSGWGIERGIDDLFIWHWGNNPGYRAFVIASVKTGNGFVMLTNSANGLKLAEPITHKILPGEHKIFRFSMLGGGFTDWLCDISGLCS